MTAADFQAKLTQAQALTCVYVVVQISDLLYYNFFIDFFFFLVYLYAPVFFVQLVSILISIQTKSTLMLCLFSHAY